VFISVAKDLRNTQVHINKIAVAGYVMILDGHKPVRCVLEITPCQINALPYRVLSFTVNLRVFIQKHSMSRREKCTDVSVGCQEERNI
jgi:hypothetical protein